MQFIWHTSDSFDSLSPITQVYGVCFDKDGRILIIRESGKDWNIPGGKPEKDETPIQTLYRELCEEASVIIGNGEMIGYNELVIGDSSVYQLRFACRIEKINEIDVDPATGVMNERFFVEPERFFEMVKIEGYRSMIVEALKWFDRQ